MNDEHALMAEYAKSGSEAAFRELLSRYIDLVYSTALRRVDGDTHLAEDVAQTVFVDLARMARSLPAGVMVGGWLHRHTCFVGSKTMRSQRRRQLRERHAVEMSTLRDHTQENLAKVASLLDEGIEQLGAKDRTAILLRFFEHRDFGSVGEALGVNAAAAQRRVSRAVERLRRFLARRGIGVGATGLVLLLSAEAVQSAPIGLTAKISAAAALSTAATHTATTFGIAKTLAMSTLQKTMIVGTLAAGLGTGIYEARRASHLQGNLQVLEQQRAVLNAQVQQLSRERDDVASRLATAQKANDSLRKDTLELPKLRAEVARLRSDSQGLAQLKAAITDDPTQSAAKSWLDRVSKLKQSLAQMPDQKIPELQFLTEEDWLNAVKNIKELSNEGHLNQALSSLRTAAKHEFAVLLQKALRSYALANNGQLAADFSQIASYLGAPLDNALLQRYEFTAPGMVSEKSTALDDQDDAYFEISAEDVSTITGSVAENTLKQALQEFSLANHGQKPTDPSQLLPYARTPAEQAVLQRLIQYPTGNVRTP